MDYSQLEDFCIDRDYIRYYNKKYSRRMKKDGGDCGLGKCTKCDYFFGRFVSRLERKKDTQMQLKHKDY